MNAKDIVAVVESVAESQNLDGGLRILDGYGRFGNIGEFLGIGFDGGLFQDLGNGVELVGWSRDNVMFLVAREVVCACVCGDLEQVDSRLLRRAGMVI